MTRTQKLALCAGLLLAANEAWQRLREIDLRDQMVLITGGSRGLGLALAHAFATQGCRIGLCARDLDELTRAKDQLRADGTDVFVLACDLRDQTAVAEMVAGMTAHFGRIDILVNNAGIIEVGPVENMAVEDFQDAMQSDFWGVLYPTLAVLPQMQERRQGRIVNITSIAGKISVPHLLPYNCAKFAATGLSEGLRAELKRSGIVVTTILPGLLRTGSFLHALFKGRQAGEYVWFSVGDNIPGMTLNAERAAAQIVQATRRGEAERVLGLPYLLAAKFQGLFPGLVSDMSALVNQALPKPDQHGGNQIKTGAEVKAESPSSVRDGATTLGFAAADRLNE